RPRGKTPGSSRKLDEVVVRELRYAFPLEARDKLSEVPTGRGLVPHEPRMTVVGSVISTRGGEQRTLGARLGPRLVPREGRRIAFGHARTLVRATDKVVHPRGRGWTRDVCVRCPGEVASAVSTESDTSARSGRAVWMFGGSGARREQTRASTCAAGAGHGLHVDAAPMGAVAGRRGRHTRALVTPSLP